MAKPYLECNILLTSFLFTLLNCFSGNRCMMAPKIEPIGFPTEIAKGSFWDEESQTLYFVDIFRHSIHNYDPKTNTHYSTVVDNGGEPVTTIIKVKGEKNMFVIASKNRLVTILWDGKSSEPVSVKHLVDLESKDATTRLNCAKCDPSNRIWAGTMGAPIPGTADEYELGKGSLYFVKKDLSIVKRLSKIGISNGQAWSADKKKTYYIDTLKETVDSYDYDDASGELSNETTVFCFKKNNILGKPDGMTIDQEGMLWVTSFGGALILRIDPNSGEVLQTLKLPSLLITSAAFGGPNYQDLYITSAKVNFTEDMEKKYPYAGYTFKVTGLGITGTPSVPVVL